MEISCIISAYNEEKYIEQCVRSVANQKTSIPFEIIVVDNNSTDHTGKTVQEKFPWARLIKETEQGMTKARNRGAKEAKGDILLFLDADTIVPEHFLERVRMQFAKNPGLVGVSGPSKFYDLPKRYRFVEFINFQILFPFVGEFLLKRVLKRGELWNGASIAARKQAFENVGGFARDIVFYGEDADLARKLMKQGDIAFARDLWVWTSARRLVKGNPVLEGLRYLVEYARFFAANKSHTTSYKEVR